MTINYSLKWKQAFCQNSAQNCNTIDYPKIGGSKQRCGGGCGGSASDVRLRLPFINVQYWEDFRMEMPADQL
jgi:hypothetical protein